MYKKILVPLDGSELAEGALPHALALAEIPGADIVLLRVPMAQLVETPHLNELMPDAQLQHEQQVYEQTMAYLERVATSLRASGVSVTCAVRYGHVATAILDVADEAHADVIAMSTHGRSGLSRWLIGSVADKVMRGAQIPVLLVRPIGAHAAMQQHEEKR